MNRHKERLEPVIAIAGYRGQLGSELLCRIAGATPFRVDVTDAMQVRRAMYAVRPKVLINAAAYTAVDAAETDKASCFDVNVRGVENLARETARFGCRLISISSDYVFDSSPLRRPLVETDHASPSGIYAWSKLESESAIELNPNHLSIRTCGLYGHGVNQPANNFVNTMLRLAESRDELSVVDDQTCCPTSVSDLAMAIEFLSNNFITGVLNVTNQGETTWFRFAKSIFEIAGVRCQVTPITTEQFGAAAPRPVYSVLDNSRYINTGAPRLPAWEQALTTFLRSSRSVTSIRSDSEPVSRTKHETATAVAGKSVSVPFDS